MTIRTLIASILAMVTLAGCGTSTGPARIDTVSVRFFHAVADSSRVTFRSAGRANDSLDYRQGSEFFAREPIATVFDARLDLVNATFASLTETLEADKWYTIALVGTRNAPQLFLFENPVTEVVTGMGLVQVVHLSAATPAVDVYLEAENADLSAANPIGTASFRQALDRVALAPATNYRLSLTTPGMPTDLLFQSANFTLAEVSNLMLAIVGNPAIPGAALSVVVSGRSASLSELTNINGVAKVRAIHTARGVDPLNVVIKDMPTPPLIEDISFGQISAPVEITSDTLELDFNPVDNAGASVLAPSATFSIAIPRTRQGLIVINDSVTTGLIAPVLQADDLRPLTGAAKIRIIHSATTAGNVDVYLVPPGTDLATVDPAIAFLAFPNESGYLTRLPGDYELVVTSPGTTTVLAGPLAAPLAALGVYGVVIVRTQDLMGVELVPIDDLAAND